jgi:glycerol-3-phosphate acyltransferase PlsY
VKDWLPLLGGSYLLGSISFSLVVVWLLQRVDLRTLGSGNPGATNVLRTSGRWPALVVLLLDIGKGIVPVEAARRMGAPAEIQAGAGLAAILGHVFPIWFGFRGGKGVATGFGVFVALFPLAGAAALVLFAALVFVTRYVSVGSVVAAAAVPPAAWLLGKSGWAAPISAVTLALAAACTLLVVLRHVSNLRRLARGTERRLGERSERSGESSGEATSA